MSRVQEPDDPRRRLLVEALALGLLTSGVPAGQAYAQGFFGSRPARLPPERSVFRIQGSASVNGSEANLETRIGPGDTVETGRESQIIFVVGGNSMILRSETKLTIEGERRDGGLGAVISGLRLLTGKVLSVSRNQQTKYSTTTATIGIRGTGLYLESDPEQTYFCLCYGIADVTANHDPASTETVASKQHDRPVYVLGQGAAGGSIRNAPFINHTDQELMLIETLVGRTPPFVFPRSDYNAPRRDY